MTTSAAIDAATGDQDRLIRTLSSEEGYYDTLLDLTRAEHRALLEGDVATVDELLGKKSPPHPPAHPPRRGTGSVRRRRSHHGRAPRRRYPELAQSGIAEMANVITGTATLKLSEVGFPAQIAPPVVIIGDQVILSTLDLAAIVVPLKTEYGEIEVNIALKEIERSPE